MKIPEAIEQAIQDQMNERAALALPSVVVQQARDIGHKLDELIERQRLSLPAPKPAS